MGLGTVVRRLFRLRPRRRIPAKERLMEAIPRDSSGDPLTPALDDILVVLERYKLSPGEEEWFAREIEREAARAVGGNHDSQEG